MTAPCHTWVVLDFADGSHDVEVLEMCPRCFKPKVSAEGQAYLRTGKVDLGRCRCPGYAT